MTGGGGSGEGEYSSEDISEWVVWFIEYKISIHESKEVAPGTPAPAIPAQNLLPRRHTSALPPGYRSHPPAIRLSSIHSAISITASSTLSTEIFSMQRKCPFGQERRPMNVHGRHDNPATSITEARLL